MDPRRKRFDWFLPALAAAIALAWLFPGPGSEHGWLHPKLLNKAGVALIFFLHGAALTPAALRAGTLRWPLHLVVQLSTFLLFQLLGLLVLALAGDAIAPDWRLGFFFLCALPSTVSSSVAMTSLAHGNVAGAVFNATLSSLLGVFFTPIWIAFLLETEGKTLSLGAVIPDLIIWLVLPLILGQLSRPWLAGLVHRHKPVIHVVDRGVILLLVYTSFCDSMASGLWQGQSVGLVTLTLGASVVLFFVVMALIALTCRLAHFSREDRIAALFCGSKKTLASGVPMAQILFAGNPGLGLILLPILIYHAFQLIASAFRVSPQRLKQLTSAWQARE